MEVDIAVFTNLTQDHLDFHGTMGAYFSDRHPDLVDEVIGQSVEIEERGLSGYARDNALTVEECFETLLTGLAVRYYKAVAS